MIDNKINLRINNEVIDFIAENSFDPVYGARPVKKSLEKLLAAPIAEFILNQDSKYDTYLDAKIEGGKITINLQEQNH